MDNVVVCSFHTADEYYRGHADNLRKNLSDIGVAHELEEIVAGPGEDWADICRKKIAFLARVCEENPGKLVFWIDVDCQLIDLPAYVANSTADLVGFQRGFNSPLSIGYGERTRFWEPCFFGINTTPAARKFIADAAALERELEIKATDDYFFEESWRANAPDLTFQVISSAAAFGRGDNPESSVTPFFIFGASGNVDEFKGKVVQHQQVGGGGSGMPSLRKLPIKLAKAVEARLPRKAAGRLRLLADRFGLTHMLTRGAHGTSNADRKRANLGKELIAAGQRGELESMAAVESKLAANGILTTAEHGTRQAAQSFAYYAGTGKDHPAISLMWWSQPYPGNFGDWLSPLVLKSVADHPITFVPTAVPSRQHHLVMVGSIGRFIKPRSIVVGTGISTEDLRLETKAAYVSVRGPVTAQVLKRSGGPAIDSFGDPGALISRVIPLERGKTNGRIAFVRHFKHATVPVALPENFDELSVLMSHPDEIEQFVKTLIGYDAVVTSAMHVMIACHSYGIPCALVGFTGFEEAVHGSGIKYRDYCEGAGVGVWEPHHVDLNLNRTNWDDLIHTEKVSSAKLDEIERAIQAGVTHYLTRVS